MDLVVLVGILAVVLVISAIVVILILIGPMRRSRPSAATPGGAGASAAAATAAADASADDGDTDSLGSWDPVAIATWAESLHAETGRCTRYGRTATVVALRLEGVDAYAETAGEPAADELGRDVVATVAGSARGSDVFQTDGNGVFRFLLIETGEDGAKSLVDRLTALVRPRLEERQATIGLVAGWAAISADGGLDVSDRLARARLKGASEGWIRSAAAHRA